MARRVISGQPRAHPVSRVWTLPEAGRQREAFSLAQEGQPALPALAAAGHGAAGVRGQEGSRGSRPARRRRPLVATSRRVAAPDRATPPSAPCSAPAPPPAPLPVAGPRRGWGEPAAAADPRAARSSQPGRVPARSPPGGPPGPGLTPRGVTGPVRPGRHRIPVAMGSCSDCSEVRSSPGYIRRAVRGPSESGGARRVRSSRGGGAAGPAVSLAALLFPARRSGRARPPPRSRAGQRRKEERRKGLGHCRGELGAGFFLGRGRQCCTGA